MDSSEGPSRAAAGLKTTLFPIRPEILLLTASQEKEVFSNSVSTTGDNNSGSGFGFNAYESCIIYPDPGARSRALRGSPELGRLDPSLQAFCRNNKYHLQ